MKSDIHPQFYTNCQVTCACGAKFITGSTLPEINVEICSLCHPFFTGEMKYVDTLGRVEKFIQKQTRASQKKYVKKSTRKTVAKAQKEAFKKQQPRTIKEMLKKVKAQQAASANKEASSPKPTLSKS